MAKDDTYSEETNGTDADGLKQSEKETKLAAQVQRLFRGSFEAKDQMDLMTNWAIFDDYVHSIQNEPETEESPGSVTNIIKPILDSQYSDILDKPLSTSAMGREPGDHMYADDVQHGLDFVMDKNEFQLKLENSEHDRLELGTTIVKEYFDKDALDGRGLPTFEIISPANFFPDPKWTAAHRLQDCEFIIHAVPRPLSYIRRQFPERGKYVKREVTYPYDPTLDIDTTRTDEVQVDTSQKALLIECYMKDEKGDIYCVHVANHIILEDSRDKQIVGKKLQRRNLFPFVAIICYPRRGTGWGMGDVEYLIPTQDLINDFDDQIRMTARMMGNPQIVIGNGMGKGFDYRKWTNMPGLRIPGRDPHAWSIVPPATVSADVVNRREKGFEEANIISGRPDVNRGDTPGNGVTAASAIIALQQAGQKTVIHKTQQLKLGWAKVLELLYDDMILHWDEGMWIRINGNEPDFKFIDPSKLRNVPIMVPNMAQMDGEDSIKQLMGTEPVMDELTGQPMIDPQTGAPMERMTEPMTREAEFDLKLNLGNGFPNDKLFVYQTLSEWAKMLVEGKPVVSWQELRNYLRGNVGLPLDSDASIVNPMMPPMGAPGLPRAPMGGIPTPSPVPQLQAVQGGAPR
jgi:hypothetical protein